MAGQATASTGPGLPYGPSPAPAQFLNELNTISKTAHQSNVLEVRVREPAASVRSGLVIWLHESLSGSGLADLPWSFTVELYRRADWSWASASPASLTIPAGSTSPIA